jgi:rSAM/selenodomain-associated transferase 2
VSTVSVVIPVWNEAEMIAGAIERAWNAGASEVIVADGESDDATRAIAGSCACRIVESPRGRARQQNAGARLATGDALLFLHVDTWLPKDAIGQIRLALANPKVNFGAFQQRIEAAGWKYRLLERGNSLRAQRLRRPYGDQGIFVRRELFCAIGGFPDAEFLEDLLLVRRLARRWRPTILPGPIFTSARRWRRNGVVRQTARNWLLLAAHRLGASPDRLAKFYAIR